MFIIALIILCPPAIIFFGGEFIAPRGARVSNPILFGLGTVLVIGITIMVAVGTGGAAAAMVGCTSFGILYLVCTD